MHSFDLPEPLSGKSTSVLLDLAVLRISLENPPGPTMSLSFGRATFHLLFFRTFLQPSISSAFIAFCWLTASVAYPSLSAPAAPSSFEKSSCPRRRTSTHFPRRTSTHLPRCLPRSSAENFATLLFSRLRPPVDPTCALTLFGGRLPLMVSFRRAGMAGPPKSVDLLQDRLHRLSLPLGPMAPPVSPPRDLAASSVSPRDPTVLPMSPPRDPMAPLVYPPQDPMAPLVPFPCDPMAIPVSPTRDSMAPPDLLLGIRQRLLCPLLWVRWRLPCLLVGIRLFLASRWHLPCIFLAIR